MSAAEVIRTSRSAAGLTQTELAARAGTSQSAIARYESGAAVPTLSTMERLLDVCGRRLVLSAEPRAGGSAGAVVREQRRRLLELARRHGARNVRVFGSVARGEAGPTSDIDLLVDLEPGRTLLDLAAFRRNAAELLGRDVDVAAAEMLSDGARREAERDSVPI